MTSSHVAHSHGERRRRLARQGTNRVSLLVSALALCVSVLVVGSVLSTQFPEWRTQITQTVDNFLQNVGNETANEFMANSYWDTSTHPTEVVRDRRAAPLLGHEHGETLRRRLITPVVHPF